MGDSDTADAADGVDKETIRQRVWDDLEESGEARFPFPPHGRIPNFAGADDAAERLAEQPEWRDATTIKANPDAPQLPVRRAALRAGKTVYMAVPRLADEKCFLKLDPDVLADYDAATTVSGSSKHGERVGPDAVEEIDLIVSGSVAVTDDGGRIGKGEGYSDLEYAILRGLGLVDDSTAVATTVHERQLVDDPVAIGDHDVAMDLVVTPERTIRPESRAQPSGIDWDLLDEGRLEEIPVLRRLQSS
ncbi:5-formyltetrahydrofolate cyclo-ligase [Haloterrigena sp. SYSU A558-1]|uniref:5-formyltetrahydrofolate cyclo-ligase n=1 Tax=Haloterrigena gelatinilytica TaxID=2741724 RepID=A0A8J8GNX8_9EURY|nr:5-formyltetrahydrofolate cyclo-ligase [Haloterrigena gelatinilytica]NUB90890.1 5-formyltetrahydrofolate cyclo-ligase [Haloterrigena gelatinilytica]NUC73291.1 5-formyltetrahydrofolate cyclo-ligase [Haloterrigena gelatinilytica]